MAVTFHTTRDIEAEISVDLEDFFEDFECEDLLNEILNAKQRELITGRLVSVYDSENIKKWAMKQFNLIEETK